MSVIIIGGGKIGFFLAERLIEEGKEVVVIEKDELRVSFLDENLDAKVILGNGASPNVLAEAGLKDAELVIAVTNSDEANLLASMIAGVESPTSKRVARIRNPQFDIEEARLRAELSINRVINPDRETARAIAKILEVPGAFDILDFFNGAVRLVGSTVLVDSELLAQPLTKLQQIFLNKKFLLAAIFRNSELMVPKGSTVLEAGDIVYFIAEPADVPVAIRILGYKFDEFKNLMINGGGFIGLNLAKTLEEKGLKTKIVEENSALCSVLTRSLDKAIILNAKATDRDFLMEEGIKNIDAFIAVTDDDESNVLSTLLAKQLGVPWTVTLVKESAYLPIITSIGVDVAINPRQLANNAILEYVRGGKVLGVSNLMDQAEIVEAEALGTSDLVGKKLKDFKLPSGILILAICKGDKVMIPDGETVIEEGNRVLFLTTRASVSKLEDLITVKLEYF